MDFEKPKELSKLEQVEIERERVKSDSNLIDRGAQDKIDEQGNARLEVTKRQVERAHSEVIEIPEDTERVKQLQEKRKDYIERIKQQKEKNQDYSDATYKKAVIDKILLEGRVEKDNLADELKKEHGIVDERALGAAMGVVEDYVQTGGKKVSGGSGFGVSIKK